MEEICSQCQNFFFLKFLYVNFKNLKRTSIQITIDTMRVTRKIAWKYEEDDIESYIILKTNSLLCMKLIS